MKFLCDKCKTRYSIGDDRVRGKILKIRCKNCANVITVREGMDISPSEPRRNPTMAIQKVDINEIAPQPAPQGALGAAFASQLTKPPPALEEEWYVSMDGNQEGPFSLHDAQRWVAGKPFEAELHCWSEGFDDWLPVDKVSHFRNLRKRSPAARAPTMPPPIPKAPPREEVKPLFAATMASIERSAGVSVPDKPQLPRIAQPAQPAIAKKANGTGVGAPLPSLRGTGPIPSPFSPEGGDSHTTVDSPVFNDSIPTTLEKPNAPPLKPAPIVPASVAPVVPATPIMDDGDDEDDNLDIGEVSRVVKLTDIAAMGRSKSSTSNPAIKTGAATQSNPALRSTASSPAIRNSTASVAALRSGMTGSHARMSPSELGMNVDPALLPPGAPAPDESILARSFAQRHRRGMIALIGVSAVIVLGVIGAVVYVMSSGESELPLGLGGTRVIDTERPEDIVRKQVTAVTTQGPNTSTTHKTTTKRPTNNITTTQPEEPETGPTSKLDASEIEAMAAKYGEGTKRCYMRAQKGALGFDIADTKKIDVTLTVNKDGTVSQVLLSKHANNDFGQCLIARIKAWKFRESRGGTFRIALAFSAS